VEGKPFTATKQQRIGSASIETKISGLLLSGRGISHVTRTANLLMGSKSAGARRRKPPSTREIILKMVTMGCCLPAHSAALGEWLSCTKRLSLKEETRSLPPMGGGNHFAPILSRKRCKNRSSEREGTPAHERATGAGLRVIEFR